MENLNLVELKQDELLEVEGGGPFILGLLFGAILGFGLVSAILSAQE